MNTQFDSPLQQRTAASARSQGAFSQFGKMKILVIDDEPANVALLEAILNERGYSRVKTITDSRLALESWRTFQPDLILLDLMMPHLDGFAILELLRADPDEAFLPVIVLTADVSEATKLRALDAGASDFLTKPFDQVEALLRIGNVLMTRHLHLQLDMQRAAYEDALRARSEELLEARAALEQMASEHR